MMPCSPTSRVGRSAVCWYDDLPGAYANDRTGVAHATFAVRPEERTEISAGTYGVSPGFVDRGALLTWCCLL
jgi:hypothetical protein